MRFVLVLTLLGVAGCATADDVRREGPATTETVGAVEESLRLAPSVAERQAAAVRYLAAVGVTPLADGSFNVARPLGADGMFGSGALPPHVGGFVPGRDPLGRAELVVLGARLDGASAAIVLEAARVLVARSPENVPERTVLVALWDSRQSDADGLAAVLRGPLWPRSSVAAAVVVGAERAARADLPITVLTPDVDRPGAVARTVAAVVEAAAYRSFSPDSTR